MATQVLHPSFDQSWVHSAPQLLQRDQSCARLQGVEGRGIKRVACAGDSDEAKGDRRRSPGAFGTKGVLYHLAVGGNWGGGMRGRAEADAGKSWLMVSDTCILPSGVLINDQWK